MKNYRIILISLIISLTGCSNNQELANKFAPDPKLKENTSILGQQQSSSSSSLSQQSSIINSNNQSSDNQNLSDFPQLIPIYPQSKLVYNPVTYQDKQQTLWTSSDKIEQIVKFYQDKLLAENWQIINQNNSEIIAKKDDFEINIIFNPVQQEVIKIFSKIPQNFDQVSIFIIGYQQTNLTQDTQQSSQSSSSISHGQSSTSILDINTIPTQLQPYINDLNALGILNLSNEKIKLNQTITRREYAVWLVTINNRLYESIPGKQIRLASPTEQPVFTDIANSDPDFAMIQGLAQSGLIPSRLNNNTTALQFRPDAPLTREDLISWKVPLDYRQALPQASIDQIKETWGFQDTASISPLALRSLYMDFQNGENSNIKRVFGYITLFQPKKTVTRAEAAATLWYFGFQGDGISVKDTYQKN